jgi:hypothetical protein
MVRSTLGWDVDGSRIDSDQGNIGARRCLYLVLVGPHSPTACQGTQISFSFVTNGIQERIPLKRRLLCENKALLTYSTLPP